MYLSSRLKGTDASWKGDVEVPDEFADFSDDEQEVNAKRRTKLGLNANEKRNSLERHQNFEKDMNVRNLIDTRLHKIRDTYEPANKKYVPNPTTNFKRGFPFCTNLRPNFAFSMQPNGSTSVPSFAQLPHVSNVFAVPPPQFARPVLPMPQFANLPPNVATFVPHLPPPMLPPPPPQSRAPLAAAMQARNPLVPDLPIFQAFPPPPPPPGEIGPPKPDTRQPPPPMMFPPYLGLPRPQAQTVAPLTSHGSTTVPPSMPFYRPPQMQQQGWFSFQNPMAVPPSSHPQHTRQYMGGGRTFYKRL